MWQPEVPGAPNTAKRLRPPCEASHGPIDSCLRGVQRGLAGNIYIY